MIDNIDLEKFIHFIESLGFIIDKNIDQYTSFIYNYDSVVIEELSNGKYIYYFNDYDNLSSNKYNINYNEPIKNKYIKKIRKNKLKKILDN